MPEQKDDTIENIKTTEIKEQPTEGNLNFSDAEEITISNLEKLEYGWDKTTNVVGNVLE